ncbi:MAG TPA: hypothetical protein VKR38_17150 [Usitatibacter sp.]|nr:hypothetical protein [Usitatibacter sp.]
MADPKNLPPEVVALLKKGDKLGAMKLMLQGSRGGGGIVGKTVMEALESAAKSGHANVRISGASLPPDVQAAFRGGNKAIDEDASGHMPMRRPSVGATKPKPSTYVKRDGLSPGEVPRSHDGLQAAIFFIAIAAAIGLYFAVF